MGASVALCWVCLSLLSSFACGSFVAPVGSGIQWRYWVQDGAVDVDILNHDLQAMSDVGSSGLELISYQSYGFPVPTDIGTTGYGSQTFKQLVDNTANIAMKYNLTLDIAAGPSQGAGVPSQNPDMEGFHTELVFGSTFIQQNQSYTGSLPHPNIFPMMKYGGSVAPAFNITSYTLQGIFLVIVTPNTNLSSHPTTITFTSIINLAGNVTGNTVSISSVSSDSFILAFYSRRTGYQEAYPSYLGPNPAEPASWGCYVVDHFSPEGAHMIDNFTTSYLFNPITPAMSKVGRLIWEDSMEFRAQLFWTGNFLSRFQTLRGYDAVSVGALPAFYSRVLAPFGGANLPDTLFAYNNDALNQQFAFDYVDTLSALYCDYIKTRNTNARNLGFRLSLQPGYGFTLDIAAAAGYVDVPEIESLAFTNVDACRQVSGGAHLGGANILSTELGAVQLEAYSQKMSEIIKLANIQFAGSVNRLVLHGFPYNGAVPLTSWPGFTTFSYVYSEMHGPRQPGWSQYRGYLSYLARTQYILQRGSTGKVDLAIYRHDFNVASSPVFASNVLQLAGYTYEYISPYNMELPLATVNNTRLALPGPGYKALIINNQHTMVVAAANKILSYAQAGLPIIVVGATPNQIPGYDPTGVNKNTVVTAMTTLLTLPNVRQVTGYDGVPAALIALNVRPAAALVGGDTTDQVYSVHRSESLTDTTNGRICTDYYWLYNTGSHPVNLSVTFETCGALVTPFYLDSWTGMIRPLSICTYINNMLIRLDEIYLYPEQTIILAFTNGTQLEGMPTNNNAVPVTHYNTPTVLIKALNQPNPNTASIPLGNWTLTVTAFQPPSNLSLFASVQVNQGPIFLGDNLTAWNTIPALAHTAGVGLYSTTFRLSSDPATMLTLLDCSSATGVIDHTVTVSLNGVVVCLAIDPSTARVELPSSLLIQGNNQLTISIATTLLNALNTVPPTQILALGGNRLSGLPFVPPDTIHGIQGQLKLVFITPKSSENNGTNTGTTTTAPPTSSSTGATPTRLPSSACGMYWGGTFNSILSMCCALVVSFTWY